MDTTQKGIHKRSQRSFPHWGLIMMPFLLLAISLFASCKSKNAETADTDIYYTCSMDPQVVEAKPGTCPICHMDLTPVKKSSKLENDNEIELSPQQIQLGNIIVDTLRMGGLGSQSVITGVLNFDEKKKSAVSARVKGRMERLYYKNIGDFIPKGAKIYDLYSEELNNAKQEYILAKQKKKELGNAIIDYDIIIESAKNKLLLWGLSVAQINQLSADSKATVTTFYSENAGYLTVLNTEEGAYVSEGSSILQLADLSTLWVEAQVYSSQLAQLQQSAKATVTIPELEGVSISGTVDFVNPEIDPTTRFNLVRIKIANTNHQLKPGMAAYVHLQNPQLQTLALPSEAVLRNGNMTVVWVSNSQNIFSSRMVQTGVESNGIIEITKGLKEGEVVVIGGAYLLQSEYIFRKGASPMGGMEM